MAGMSNARGRTLNRMKLLLTTASAAALPACSSGYGVVDPMPPPAVCPGADTSVKAQAQFETHSAGETLVAIQLQPSSVANFTYLDDEPVASGGVVVTHGRIGSAYEARIRVDSGATTATLQVPFSCSSGKDGVTVTMTWKRVDPSEPINVKISQRY
jgi:hypothetical protein